MTIYTRFGGEVTAIVAECGDHELQKGKGKLTLVLCRIDYHDEETTSFHYQFKEFLKAGNGWQEIENMVSAAPKVKLTALDLKRAIKEAE